MKKGLGYLASRGALALGAAAALPFTLMPGMLTAGFLGADFLCGISIKITEMEKLEWMK